MTDPISLVIGGIMLLIIGGISAEGLWRRLRTPATNNGGYSAPQYEAPTPAAPAGVSRIGRLRTDDMKPHERQHTAVVGSTGDGKTTTMNSLLVGDIAAGAQCIVCSTHFTYWHPDDQRIDLRPLKDKFQAVHTAQGIRSVLDAACKLKDVRMNLYRAGKPVGHDVCLYLGEWDTSIQRLLGEWATDRLQELLDEGRKTNVWIAFVEVHGAQVKRFGGDSALRAAFRTRLTGNVDSTSWRAFVGSQTPQTKQPRGQWMTDRGAVSVEPPTIEQIERIAAADLPVYAPLMSDALPTPDADRLLEKMNGVQESLNAVNGRSPHSDARSSGSERSAFSPQAAENDASEVLNVNADELRRLTKALALRAQGKSKQEAIETAFECKKGAGEAWRRASTLFDAAT